MNTNAPASTFYISEFLASNNGNGTNALRDEDPERRELWIAQRLVRQRAHLEHVIGADLLAGGLALAAIAIDARPERAGACLAGGAGLAHVPDTQRCSTSVSTKASSASTAGSTSPAPASTTASSTDMPAISVTTARGTSPGARRPSRCSA